MNITSAILSLVDRYGLSPEHINRGGCSGFAYQITKQISGAVSMWSGTHCYIMYNSKYYDSECPQGCSDPNSLPFFKRMEDE